MKEHQLEKAERRFCKMECAAQGVLQRSAASHQTTRLSSALSAKLQVTLGSVIKEFSHSGAAGDPAADWRCPNYRCRLQFSPVPVRDRSLCLPGLGQGDLAPQIKLSHIPQWWWLPVPSVTSSHRCLLNTNESR
jgi:hypothetical protein